MNAVNEIKPTLVLGLGNMLLRDEGIGVHVVAALRDVALPDSVEVVDGATAGLELLDVLEGRRKVVVVDAMGGDCAPGTVLRLAPEDLLPQAEPTVSLHEVGLFETLAVGRRIGVEPSEVVIIGARPFELDCGLELSASMRQLLPEIIDVVLKEVGIAGAKRREVA